MSDFAIWLHTIIAWYLHQWHFNFFTTLAVHIIGLSALNIVFTNRYFEGEKWQ
jgi:hypothetical protein